MKPLMLAFAAYCSKLADFIERLPAEGSYVYGCRGDIKESVGLEALAPLWLFVGSMSGTEGS